jgi:hypothetical protein
MPPGTGRTGAGEQQSAPVASRDVARAHDPPALVVSQAPNRRSSGVSKIGLSDVKNWLVSAIRHGESSTHEPPRSPSRARRSKTKAQPMAGHQMRFRRPAEDRRLRLSPGIGLSPRLSQSSPACPSDIDAILDLKLPATQRGNDHRNPRAPLAMPTCAANPAANRGGRFRIGTDVLSCAVALCGCRLVTTYFIPDTYESHGNLYWWLSARSDKNPRVTPMGDRRVPASKTGG